MLNLSFISKTRLYISFNLMQFTLHVIPRLHDTTGCQTGLKPVWQQVVSYKRGFNKQVVIVIWHKAASPPHTDDSVVFAKWRQCAPIYRKPKNVAMATTLSTSGLPSNTWFLGPIRAHNPNSISIGSTVFAQMTAEYPYTLQWDASSPPQNCPFSWGIWTPI